MLFWPTGMNVPPQKKSQDKLKKIGESVASGLNATVTVSISD